MRAHHHAWALPWTGGEGERRLQETGSVVAHGLAGPLHVDNSAPNPTATKALPTPVMQLAASVQSAGSSLGSSPMALGSPGAEVAVPVRRRRMAALGRRFRSVLQDLMTASRTAQ